MLNSAIKILHQLHPTWISLSGIQQFLDPVWFTLKGKHSPVKLMGFVWYNLRFLSLPLGVWHYKKKTFIQNLSLSKVMPQPVLTDMIFEAATFLIPGFLKTFLKIKVHFETLNERQM